MARIVDKSVSDRKAAETARREREERDHAALEAGQRARQAAGLEAIASLVRRVEAACGGLRLREEETLWFFLHLRGGQHWLPPADWEWDGPLDGEGVTHRTLVMASHIRQGRPGISDGELYRMVMDAQPWTLRAGPGGARSLAPVAWVFSLLLEAWGAPRGPATRTLIFDLAARVRPQDAQTAGQKAERVRLALRRLDDRVVGGQRLEHALQMAEAYWETDAFGLASHVARRRGNSDQDAPPKKA